MKTYTLQTFHTQQKQIRFPKGTTNSQYTQTANCTIDVAYGNIMTLQNSITTAMQWIHAGVFDTLIAVLIGTNTCKKRDCMYGTPIEACIITTCQSNNQSKNCINFRCFELIVNAATNVVQLDFGKIFHKCIEYGCYAMIKYLIENKEDLGISKHINTTDDDGHNCLIKAAISKYNYQLFSVLFESKLFDINFDFRCELNEYKSNISFILLWIFTMWYDRIL